MKNKESLQKYFNGKYYNKNKNHKEIMSKIKNQENKSKNYFIKMVATIVITLLGATGLVFASTKIYNEYIKKYNDEIEAKELFYTGEMAEIDGENVKLYSDEILSNTMIYDENARLYYKIISNKDLYLEYKSKVRGLPEESEVDFNENFFVIITNSGSELYLHRRDLKIDTIEADENTMYINLIPKEDANYDKLHTELYAVVDKSLLRENINIRIDTSVFKIEGLKPISSLPKDYSKEDAIEDGCMVIERPSVDDEHKVISQNQNALDELIKKSENGVESYIRVYFNEMQEIRILDIQYKNGIFIIEDGHPGESTVTKTFKYITKEKFKDNTYMYQCNNTKKDPLYSQMILLLVTFD